MAGPLKHIRIVEFETRSRDDWAAHFERTDACVTPVLMPWEAPNHPHDRARGTFAGAPVQPAPGPRLSRHSGRGELVETRPDAEREALLARWGVAPAGPVEPH